MAIPTVLIGVLPTYGHIGIMASICLVIFRLVQGFAAGGELPLSACYIYEASPSERRNFLCSIVAASPMIGVLLGSIVSFLIYGIFTKEAVISYAWRIPFLIGFFVLLLIFYVRKSIDETAEFKKIHFDTANRKNFFSLGGLKEVKVLFHIIVLYSFIQATFYLLFVWMPSYLSVFLSVDKTKSFLSNSIGLLALVIFTLIVGYFAEHIKHKKLVLLSVISVGVAIYPVFLLIQTKNFIVILLAQIFFAACLSFVDGVIVNILTRSFSSVIRCRNVSVGFTLPTAILGGILPTISSYLIYKTGITIMPVFFIGFISLITLPIVVRSKII